MRLKKMGISLAVLVMLITLVPAASLAKGFDPNNMVLEVYVNEVKDGIVEERRVSAPNAAPFRDKNNRIMLPLKSVVEEMNGTLEWNGKTQTATIKRGNDTMVITVNNKTYSVNGSVKKLKDSTMIIKSGKTYIPLSVFSGNFGMKVEIAAIGSVVWISTPEAIAKAKEPYDWDAWERYKNEEGKSEPFQNEGFTFNRFYNSGLVVNGEDYRKEDGTTRPVIDFLITFGNVGGDFIPEKLIDTEKILRQQVESKTVDAVINYAKKKKEREDELLEKTFKDKTYEIDVSSRSYDSLIISVWYREK